MTHTGEWCMERPWRIANMTPNENIKVFFYLDFDGKWDPWNGYDAASFENKDEDALKGENKYYISFRQALKFKQVNKHALIASKKKQNTLVQTAASHVELFDCMNMLEKMESHADDTIMGKYDNASKTPAPAEEKWLVTWETDVSDLDQKLIAKALKKGDEKTE